MDLELRGKRALITGASKGIGRAVAEVLAEEGCDLYLVARDAQSLEQGAEEIRRRANVSIQALPADLARGEDQRRVAEACRDVDILINNAGSNPAGEIDEVDEQTWRSAWDLKVFGYVNLCRSFYSAMKARGGGVIVNIIGNSGERMNPMYILGSSGNAGLMAMTRALGARATDFGVRVVGVNPGLTATDRAERMLRVWSEQQYGTSERWQEVQRGMNLPFGRMGKPREVAQVVAFVASPRASYVSGTIITVDGGGTNRNW